MSAFKRVFLMQTEVCPMLISLKALCIASLPIHNLVTNQLSSNGFIAYLPTNIFAEIRTENKNGRKRKPSVFCLITSTVQ